MCRTNLFLVAAVLLSPLLLQAIEVGDPAPEAGTLLTLDNGDRVQFLVEENKVRAYFLDEEGLVKEATAESIIFLVDDPGRRNDEWRGLLQSGDDAGLLCPKYLHPPYQIRAQLIFRYPGDLTITRSKVPLDLTEARGGE